MFFFIGPKKKTCPYSASRQYIEDIYRYIEHRAQSTGHRAHSNADMPIAQCICKQAGGAVFAVVYCT